MKTETEANLANTGQQKLFSLRSMLVLVLPMAAEQAVFVTTETAKGLMMSHLGQAAFSGFSLVTNINYLIYNLFSAFTVGGSVICAQYLGSKQRENAKNSGRHLLFGMVIFSFIITLLVGANAGPIIRGLYGSAGQEITLSGITVLFWTALSYPFLAVQYTGTAIFKAAKRPKLSLIAACLQNGADLALNAAVIYGFNLGLCAAVAATLLVRFISAVLMLFLLARGYAGFSVMLWRGQRFKRRMFLSILKLGLPMGIENALFEFGKLFVSGLLSTLGAVAIAANGVCNGIFWFSQIPSTAIGYAMVTVTGQCMGAKRPKEAQKNIVLLTFGSVVVYAVTSLLIVLLLKPILGLYNLSSDVESLSKTLLVQCLAVSTVLWPFAITLPNGLRAAGDVKFAMALSLSSLWIFRILSSYILVLHFNMDIFGIWLAMYIDWAIRSAGFVFRFLKGKWQNIKVI